MTAIPQQLTQDGLFCCWRYEERNGKPIKVPYQPETSQRAKSNDPSCFTSFEAAANATGYDGIGIGIFNGICAIDLDNCITGLGCYTETAAEIVELMHSYTELSPSGNGVHILFRADGFQYDTDRYYIMNHPASIEVYVAGATSKYVTFTGNQLEAYEFGDRTAELQTLLERYMVRPETHTTNAINAANSLDVHELLQLAKSSRNGSAFTALWNGSTEGYGSHSEADMALCGHLAFWTGRNTAQMDTLFRQSGLMRRKWDREQSGSTYGAITIARACEACKEVYVPKQNNEPTFPPIVPLTPQWCGLPSFPLDALPDFIRNYVKAVAEFSQTSPDMAAVISLGVLAVCLQGKYEIESPSGFSEPLSLYTAVIAAPGERKSSVMRAMTKALYDYERDYNKARAEEIQENRRSRQRLERQISGLRKSLERSYDRETELELMQLEDQLEDTPELKPVRFFADDCSSEALTSLMADNRGIFSVISAEGGIFDIMVERYSQKANIDVWLKGHCGDTIRVDRMTRESESIDHPALSAILSIQPSVLEEIMSNTTMSGRGLLARFLYASPPSRIGQRTFCASPIMEEFEERYHWLIYNLMEIPVEEEPKKLKLTTPAYFRMIDYFQEHEQFLVGEGQAIADWASKYIGAVLRIAGLIHVATFKNMEVEVETIEHAIQIGKYFLAHAIYAYSLMGTDLSIQKATFVLAKLKKKNVTTIKRSELFQMCRGKFFRKTEDILPTLDLLAAHGYIRQKEPQRQSAGRPPDVRIIVNPEAL